MILYVIDASKKGSKFQGLFDLVVSFLESHNILWLQ